MRAVNLIPAEQRSRGGLSAGRSGGGAFVVLGLLAGVALLALLYGTARHQISSREGTAARLTAEAQKAESEASRLAPYTSFIALDEQRKEEVSTLLSSRFDWAHSMSELGRVLPPHVKLSSLTGTVGAAAAAPATTPPETSTTGASTSSPVTSVTPPGSTPTLALTGCAPSQSAVALTIERLRLMDGVGSVTLQSSTKQGGSSSSGSATAPGGCEGAQFSMSVTFEGLPAPTAPASGPSSTDAAAGSEAGAAAGSSTGSTAGASTEAAR